MPGQPRPHRLRLGRVMRRFALLLALGTLVVSCAAPPPPMSTEPEAKAARAVEVVGPFTLTFELPKSTWKAGEPITGEASLSVADGAGTIYGSAGEPLHFAFKELTGRRVMGPASDAACARYELAADAPIVAPIGKSGGWSDDEPDGAFYRDFFTSPDIRLPAGDWVVTASAEFLVGRDCSGPMRTLSAPIVLHVTD
jgi:hypothetical protein